MNTRQPTKPARELAARALCRRAGNPENTMFEGKPMWMSYLEDADAVLEAIGWREDKRGDEPADDRGMGRLGGGGVTSPDLLALQL